MENEKSLSVLKAVIDEQEDDAQEIEFEICIPETEDERLALLKEGIFEIDTLLAENGEKIDKLNTEIDRLTNKADAIDYAIAVTSGVLTGLIDAFFVGEFSFEKANSWGNDKIEKFVKKVGGNDDLVKAVDKLEKNNPIPADKVKDKFGGAKQHHLRDFSHHASITGLIFSLLTQFTGCVYGTDTSGVFKIEKVPNGELIGKDIYEKLSIGIIKWFFHMISDFAGASSTLRNGGSPTGIPGPVLSTLKEISALPIFKKNVNGDKEFSVLLSKLYNGTLLAKRDGGGKILEPIKFDLKTEIGLAHELGKQAIPVIMNECIVRSFYFIRRLSWEIKRKNCASFKELEYINWKAILPFKNRTIVRMMTIASSTFTAVDIADAAIRSAAKSGGNPVVFASNMILRVNFVGVGRCVVAIGTDIGMGIKKSKLENERMLVHAERLHLLNAKVFYKQGEMWIAAESTEKALEEAEKMMEKTIILYSESIKEMENNFETIGEYVSGIEDNNPDLTEELLDILEL